MHRVTIYSAIWTIIAAMIIAAPAFPDDGFFITPRVRQMVPVDAHVSASLGLSADLGWENFGLRFTFDDTQYNYSEVLYDISFWGVGPVIRFKPIDGLHLSAAALYFVPDASLNDHIKESFQYAAADILVGVDPKQIKRFAKTERKNLDVSSAWGGEFSVEYARAWKWLEFGIEGGYRMLTFNRKIYSYEPGGAYWIVQGHDRFDAGMVGLFIRGSF